MLQNILTGFDILGVGIIVGSLALLWAFWKVLHDDLQFEGAALPSPEPEATRTRVERAPSVRASSGLAASPRTADAELSAAPTGTPAREQVRENLWEPTGMEPVFFHIVETATSSTPGASR